jgi:hypothetical protein
MTNEFLKRLTDNERHKEAAINCLRDPTVAAYIRANHEKVREIKAKTKVAAVK